MYWYEKAKEQSGAAVWLAYMYRVYKPPDHREGWGTEPYHILTILEEGVGYTYHTYTEH